MNKLVIAIVSATVMFASAANAEYMMKIPLEEPNGGALPNNSIVFVPASSIPVEEPEPEEQIPEGLEGYQNINGSMSYSTDANQYGPYSSSRADEMTHKINSAKNDVIIVTVNAGYKTDGACGIGPCNAVYSASVGIDIDGSVQDVVEKASFVVFSDANNSNVRCNITRLSIFMTMDQTTFRDEYNTRVNCNLESYSMPQGAGSMNYSVSIK